jgi:hypothetical protein|uniref:Uncharacterized protein n=1 Tax=viral metagenome TaxID=1070528 RepID=A0A6C0H9P2_9ZZZZ
MLCKYKNIFGQVNTGTHSYRLFNIAIIDVIFTILGAYILYKLQIFIFSKYHITFINILIFLFILGIILHKLFCVDTTINKILFN